MMNHLLGILLVIVMACITAMYFGWALMTLTIHPDNAAAVFLAPIGIGAGWLAVWAFARHAK